MRFSITAVIVTLASFAAAKPIHVTQLKSRAVNSTDATGLVTSVLAQIQLHTAVISK